jgi:hypothetical protein
MARLPQHEEWKAVSSLDRCRVDGDGLRYLESWRLAYDGEEWLIGERAERLGLPAMHVMTVGKADASTRLLVLAALSALDCGTMADICVGVPLHGYWRERERLRDLMKGEHRVVAGGRDRTFLLRGTVAPEGLGIWLAAAWQGTDLDEQLLRAPTVVLDFGHRTVQVAVFTGLRVHPTFYVSGHGVYEVWEAALVEALEGPDQTVYESPQRAVMMTRLLREGRVSVRGAEITLQQLAPRLAAHAERLWPRLKAEILRTLVGIPYERVVAGGGGVHVYWDQVRELFEGKAVLLADRFAQAEGYRLFLEHREIVEDRA